MYHMPCAICSESIGRGSFKVESCMIKKVILITLTFHIAALFFLMLFPGEAQVDNLLKLALLNFSFIAIVYSVGLISFLFFVIVLGRNKIYAAKPDPEIIFYNLKVIAAISVLGVTLIAYDRVFIRDINYFELGLRAARYEWRSSVGGNIFGVIGNILTSFSYVGVFMSMRHYKVVSGSLLILIVCISVILSHSILNGGRSNLFIAFILILTAYCLSEKSSTAIKPNYINLLLGFGVFAVVAFYIAQVIESSAELGGIRLKELLFLAIIEMQGAPDMEFFNEEISDFCALFLYSVLYLFHGQWTAQAIFDLVNRPGFHSIVSAPTVIMDQLGLIDLGLDERAFSEFGAFVPLASALFYDFGIIGFVAATMIIGVLLGLSLFYIKKRKYYDLCGGVIVLFTIPLLIVAPILPVYGFAYFSFFIFAFVLYNILMGRFLFRKTLS